MRACWLKWVGRDWSISADYIWLNYSGANSNAMRWRASASYFLSHQVELMSLCTVDFSFLRFELVVEHGTSSNHY